jgi:replicative DNA helicase
VAPVGSPQREASMSSGRRRHLEVASAQSRTPPHNLEAEESVLGAVLLAGRLLPESEPRLTEEDFYRPAHRTVWRTITAMAGEGQAIDAVTVAERLRRSGELADIGGAPFLHTLISAVPTAANATHYARIVKEAAVLRRLIDLGGRITQLGYEAPQDAERAVAEAAALVNRVTDEAQRLRGGGVVTGAALLAEWERYVDACGTEPVVTWGLPDLDASTGGGLRPEQLVLVAARPKSGKSSLAIQVADHVIGKGGHVVFATYEMSVAEIVAHLLAPRLGLALQRCLRLEALQHPRFGAAVGSLAGRLEHLAVLTDRLDVLRLAAHLEELHRQRPIDLVVVDHLHQMPRAEASTTLTEEQEVGERSGTLKLVAGRLGTAVLACAQLNREPTRRSDKRPTLTDLRASGRLEQDADVVVFLHRPSYYDPDAPVEQAFAIVAAQRMGPPGEVELRWDPERALFQSLSHLTGGGG